ncbi:Mor transcription activator family protein [Vibrio coralliilyticus]|uniref:Mor transcription activator domain-containing protein n=1 Tax=Vibrio coralliilyticus TaxID=190893 RepID=A0AAP6ZN78_9VIBR|nr:Mor transcription activator family protein [Vibrio coralliilyticus]NOJ21928.1 hypothetical protein [Vibrio coralliilyticus]
MGKQMNSQHEMFEHDSIDARVLDNLDHLMEEENEWPVTFLQLRDVLAEELKGKLPEHKRISLSLALAVGQYIGGMSIYLPNGQSLQRYIRDINIREAFDGANVKPLALKFRLREKAIYEVLRRMRAVSTQRGQLLQTQVREMDSKWDRYFETIDIEGEIHIEEEKKKWPMILLELRTLLLKELETYEVNAHEIALSIVLADTLLFVLVLRCCRF